jgi:hypothetical protein
MVYIVYGNEKHKIVDTIAIMKLRIYSFSITEEFFNCKNAKVEKFKKDISNIPKNIFLII